MSTIEPPKFTPRSLVEAVFDAALYKRFEIPSTAHLLKGVRLGITKIDRHCPQCDQGTTWTTTISADDKRNGEVEKASVVNVGPGSIGKAPKVEWDNDFVLRLFCARNALHQCTLFIRVESPDLYDRLDAKTDKTPLPPTKVVKVGQYPSLADIQLGTLKDYEEGMSVQQRSEFVRAINTSAHGFNVAACVHYRRVFESVLFEARDAMMRDTGRVDWPEFDRLRTDEKIAEVRQYLPQFMAEHPHLYGILSKGVHELTEEECGEAMPTLRQAIELMLQDKVDAIRREKRRQAASVMLAKTVDKHKG